MQLAVIAIAGAVGLSVLGGMAATINNAAYHRGVQACQDANRKVTDKLNRAIKDLNQKLQTEREQSKADRDEKLNQLLTSNTGDACIPDDAYRNRLNGILRRRG